jgi:hypothetical protein
MGKCSSLAGKERRKEEDGSKLWAPSMKRYDGFRVTITILSSVVIVRRKKVQRRAVFSDFFKSPLALN